MRIYGNIAGDAYHANNCYILLTFFTTLCHCSIVFLRINNTTLKQNLMGVLIPHGLMSVYFATNHVTFLSFFSLPLLSRFRFTFTLWLLICLFSFRLHRRRHHLFL